MDIATIRPMDLGPKFSWPLFIFLSISLLFTLFTVMMRFCCSVYKHNWSEVDIWGMDDYIQLYLFQIHFS